MAAQRVILTFDDGRTETVTLNPRCLMEAEQHYGNSMPPIAGTMFAAWVRSGRPATFDKWVDTIESIDQGGAATPPTPTHPAASAGS